MPIKLAQNADSIARQAFVLGAVVSVPLPWKADPVIDIPSAITLRENRVY
jgi:hypothetical protein